MSQARTTVPAETLENLLAAYSGERNATARYIAFSVQADKEGFLGVGSMFRAAAHSEQVHATNHATVLRKYGADLHVSVEPFEVKTTVENLRMAIQGEQDERDQVYPAYADLARYEHCDDAADSFDAASDVETVHAMMFEAALDNLRDYRERSEYLVCTACGWLSLGANFKRCILCNSPRSRFDRID